MHLAFLDGFFQFLRHIAICGGKFKAINGSLDCEFNDPQSNVFGDQMGTLQGETELPGLIKKRGILVEGRIRGKTKKYKFRSGKRVKHEPPFKSVISCKK